jgi:hypothetical protein
VSTESSSAETSTPSPTLSGTTPGSAPRDLAGIPGGLFENTTYDRVLGSIDRVFADRLLDWRATASGNPDSRLQIAVFNMAPDDLSKIEAATGLKGRIDVLPAATRPEDAATLQHVLADAMHRVGAIGDVTRGIDWSARPVVSVAEVTCTAAPGLKAALDRAANGRPYVLHLVSNATSP